jgi:hypothetical protein
MGRLHRDLEEFVEEHGLIDRLYVFDHGFSGGQWVGDVVLTPEMAEDLEPFLDDDAVILLGGCDVARDREYLEDIAEAANAIVIASDDDVIYWPFPNPFGRDYYSKGDWIPGEPPDSGR